MLDEGESGTVTVELSATLPEDVIIPVTVSGSVTGRGTGRYTIGDLENPARIEFTIAAGTTESSRQIRVHEDTNRAHQFITLALDWDKLPTSVLWGIRHSVQIGVRDVTAPPVIPTVRVLEVVPDPVPEGSTVGVALLLSDVQPVDVRIPLTLTAGTAEAGDYGTLASITIPAAHCCATGYITTNRDADDEDETFTVALGSSLPAPVEAGSPASALVTISEGNGAPPDTGGPGPEGGGQEPPSVSLPAASNPVTEGASVTVTARLTAALPEDVDIPVRVERDTSEEDDHGTLASIRIRSGARHGTGTIETMQDADTDDETFMVELGESLPSTVTLGSPDSVKITITDDDQQQPPGGNGPPGGGGGPPAAADATVSLSATPNPVTEGNPVTVTATLTAALSEAVTIPLTLTAGTAEAGDYGPLGSIRISGGETSGTGTITTAVDADTDDETFTVALGSSLPAPVEAGSPSSVEVTIDDTTTSTVGLAVAPNPVPEGSSVTVTATLTVALSEAVRIPLSVTRGTSEAGDHGTLAGIRINAGETSGTGTITTAVDADTDDETFTVALGSSLPAPVEAGSPSSVEVTIDDTTTSTVGLAVAPNPVPEGSSVTVTATLTVALSEAVRIPLSVTRGTSEAGDHGTLAGIRINAGETSGTGTITTAVDADTDDETFTVALGSSLPAPVEAGSPSSVEVTIDDTTTSTVGLAVAPNPVPEGSSVTVTATLTVALSEAVRIPLSVRRGTSEAGDHGTLAGITINAGATSGTGTITTAVDADTDDETFTVALGSSLPAPVEAGSPSSVEVTIDDTTTSTVGLAVAPNPVPEGSSVTVTATLTVAFSEAVRIPLSVRRGTSEPGDHGTLAGITINAGATSGTGMVTTAADPDTDDETFTVALGNDLPASVKAGSPDSVEVTIVDDDTATVALAAAPNPVPEGSSVTVTATLTVAFSEAVSIPLSVTRGTSEAGDHGTLAGITINAGETSGTGTITTAVDADTDDETFTVALGSSLPAPVEAGSPSSVEVTIGDTTTSTVGLAVAPNPVPEGSSVTVTATLTAALSEAVTIPLTLTAGTAEAGDYGPLAGIRISGGETSGTGTITTAADADTDDETFTVALGNDLPVTVEAGSPDSVEVTITDATIPTVALAVAPNPVPEGSSVTVTATLTVALSEAVRIPLRVRRGTAEPGDHGTLAGITINAGATSGTGMVPTAVDADTDDETFTVALGSSLPVSVSAGSPSSVAVTIKDTTTTLTLDADREPAEGGPAVTVTATLSNPAPANGTAVTLAVSGTATRDTGAGGDYRLSSSMISIAAGATAGTVTITVIDDADDDDGETIVLAATSDTPALAARLTLTITDNDEAPIPPSTDASLSDLQLSEGTLEPRFAAATQSYTAEVAHEVASVTVTPTARDSRATVTVNGAAVASDSASAPISLREGGETIIAVEVTAEDAETTRTYTVAVTRAAAPPTPPSTDASLSDLQLSEGTLEPRFAAATQSYTADVAPEVASVTVTPTARDSRATVTVNGAAVASGSASAPVSLREGSETTIAVEVTAEDAETTRTYTVRVTRAAAEPTVTEEHREQRLQVGLAGLGRTVAASAVSVIGQRLAPATPQAGAEAELAGVDLTLNRRALRLPAAGDTAAGGRLAHQALQALGVSVTPAGKLSVVPVSDVELLSGSAFGAHQGAVPGWGFWGSGAASGFHGEVDEFEQEGGVLAGYLGADYRFGAGALAGLAASYHNLELSVTSSAAGEADLTGGVVNVYPYGFWMPAEWLGLWAVVGFGAGGAEVADAGDSEEGELGSWLGAAGQRVEFLSGGGLSLAAKADGFVTGLTAGGGLPAVSGHAWRARALLEGGLEWHAPDTRLAGQVELGGRLDGGDAEQGLGVEAGAQVSYTHTGIGLGLDGRGRLLLVHEDQALRDWGASATLRWEPAGPGTGPALSVAPAWGRVVASGPGVLWQDQPLAQELVSSAGATAGEVAPWLPDSVALRLSYGLEVAAGAGRVRPYAEVGLDPAAVRRVRAGATADLSPVGAAPGGVRLEAFGQRTALPGGGAEYRLGLEGSLEY